MNKLTFVFLAIIISLFLYVSLSHAATFEISVVDSSFLPANRTINIGDTVRWSNFGSLSHTSTSGVDGNSTDGLWNSGILSPGDSFSLIFNQAGIFPYHCSFHWFTGMKGTITVSLSTSPMPVPPGQQDFSYSPIETPVVSSDPSQAKPIGVGSVAAGGDTLSLQVGLNQFSGPVDIYLAIAAPDVVPDIYMIKSDLTLQPISVVGLVPWMANTTGPIDADLFGNVTGLPAATYFLYIAVAPAGSVDSYYLWTTSFTIP